MIKIIRWFRCFISWLLFEKIRGFSSANDVAMGVIADTAKYNRSRRSASCCWHCRGSNVISDRSGSDGFFTWVNHFYRCADCGNTQSSDGSSPYCWESKELESAGVTMDGDWYRYTLMSEGWGIVMIACMMLFALWGTLYFHLFLDWSVIKSITVGFGPLCLGVVHLFIS